MTQRESKLSYTTGRLSCGFIGPDYCVKKLRPSLVGRPGNDYIRLAPSHKEQSMVNRIQTLHYFLLLHWKKRWRQYHTLSHYRIVNCWRTWPVFSWTLDKKKNCSQPNQRMVEHLSSFHCVWYNFGHVKNSESDRLHPFIPIDGPDARPPIVTGQQSLMKRGKIYFPE